MAPALRERNSLSPGICCGSSLPSLPPLLEPSAPSTVLSQTSHTFTQGLESPPEKASTILSFLFKGFSKFYYVVVLKKLMTII